MPGSEQTISKSHDRSSATNRNRDNVTPKRHRRTLRSMSHSQYILLSIFTARSPGSTTTYGNLRIVRACFDFRVVCRRKRPLIGCLSVLYIFPETKSKVFKEKRRKISGWLKRRQSDAATSLSLLPLADVHGSAPKSPP